MTTEPLDFAESYFQWLYGQVAPVRLKNPARTYWSLLRQLHDKEFVYFVPNDDNRAEDGRALRLEFVEEAKVDPGQWFFDEGCSVLEMLVALSRRMTFLADRDVRYWFWLMLDNLGLTHFNDAYCDDANYDTQDLIDAALDRLINRTYDQDGNGGLFPLFNADKDQTKVEIWYQMNYYLLERG